MKITSSVCVVLCALLLAGCETLRGARNPDSIGLATSKTDALAFQADQRFGSTLTGKERQRLSVAERKALDYGTNGQQVGWKGDSDKVSGVIVAFQPFQVGTANCRRFEHRLNAKKGQEKAIGTACKRADGQWRLVK